MDSATDRRHSSPGFPHSGIPGSRPACGFPRLIAACYALHRLLMPRHPPYTLSNLTSLTSDTHDLGSVYSVVKEQPVGTGTDLILFGGAERDRTADPLVANQVLSRLSYSPLMPVTPVKGEEPALAPRYLKPLQNGHVPHRHSRESGNPRLVFQRRAAGARRDRVVGKHCPHPAKTSFHPSFRWWA